MKSISREKGVPPELLRAGDSLDDPDPSGLENSSPGDEVLHRIANLSEMSGCDQVGGSYQAKIGL